MLTNISFALLKHPPPSPLSRLFRVGTMAVVSLLALPQAALAKGPKSYSRGNGHAKHNQAAQLRIGDTHDRQIYAAHPQTGFTLSLGTGYAGRGYYYGPPNSPYYYARSDVRYYATRAAAPREYYVQGDYGDRATDVNVQRALARRGYYHGSIDGQIGPQSRRAIASYQQDRGMRPTGSISSGLLRSLGLE